MSQIWPPSINQPTVGQMSVGQMSVGQMSVGLIVLEQKTEPSSETARFLSYS